MKKKAIAFISAFILILSTAIPAFAEIDKESVTNAWFKYVWETDGGNQSYERKTGNVVPVSENPFAATTYARIEQTVEKLTEEDYRKILFDINSESSLEDLNSTFWGYWDGHDIDIGLTLLYDNGLERYDDGDYQKDGVWLVSESSNELYSDEKYRHIKFIDNGDSFTMVTEQGNEELGTYKKVYGFDTDADIGYSGGGGGSTGGSTGTSSSTGNTSNSSNDTVTTINSNSTTSTSSADSTSKDVAVTAGRTSSVATGSNPPVTPEVVSAVDAAKSAKEAENNSATVSSDSAVTVVKPQKSETNIFEIIVIILVIGVIAYLIIQKKKGDNNGKINSD